MAKRAAHISIVVTAYKGPVLRLQLNQDDRPGRMRVRRDGRLSCKLGESVTPTAFGQTLSRWIGKELPRAAIRELKAMMSHEKAH